MCKMERGRRGRKKIEREGVRKGERERVCILQRISRRLKLRQRNTS